MLICFGAAWPLSIYKSYRSRSNEGKSPWFLYTILVGYISGSIYKVTENFDYVFYLYVLNGLMVVVDILLYYRNALIHRSTADDADVVETAQRRVVD